MNGFIYISIHQLNVYKQTKPAAIDLCPSAGVLFRITYVNKVNKLPSMKSKNRKQITKYKLTEVTYEPKHPF